MSEQSRAGTMLAILKKQYEPEAEALAKAGHVPEEGRELVVNRPEATARRLDPDEWLKRRLAERGLTQQDVLTRMQAPQVQAQSAARPKTPPQPILLPQPKLLTQPVVQTQPILLPQPELLPQALQSQPKSLPQPVVHKKKLFGIFGKKEKKSQPVTKMPAQSVLQTQPELPQLKFQGPEILQEPKLQPQSAAALQPQAGNDMQRVLEMQQQVAQQVPARSQVQSQVQPAGKKSLRGMLYRKLKTEKPSVYPKFVIEREKLSAIVPREEVKDHHVVYPLIKPFAYASIKWDNIDNAMVYSIVEPTVSEEDKHILEKLKEGLIQIINVSFEDIRNQTTMVDFLEEHVRKLLYEYDFTVSAERYMNIMYYIFRDFIGLNEIEPFLRDPYIEDIGADGVNVPVYVVHQKYGSLRTNIIYHDEEKLKEFVTKLAERCDRYISYAEPLLDGTLPDGTRVHASLAADVTTRGPTFSIRKFRETPFTPVDMVKMNTASPEMLAYLWFVVQNSSNILVTGGVSTGKTSLLNCLSLFIPPEAKVVSIEDTRELSLPHENWIPGVARVGFSGTGVGEVTMFELLRESFRQNPDYLIVGEIRGKEAYVMFQAMASGHPSMATMHAGSIDDVIKRLQTHPINLSAGLLESLDLILVMVHAREKGKSARRVKEVVELQSVDAESGRARALKSFVWLPALDTFEYRGDSWVLHKISKEKGIPMDKIMKDISQRKKLINWMVENNIIAINDVVKYINLYYRTPEKLKDAIGGSE